jgi:hypothetical protein
VILLVTYDLKQPAASYTDLFEILKSKDSWWHYLSSTWLVATDESPNELNQQLIPHIFNGDRLLVAPLEPDRAGWQGRLARAPVPTRLWLAQAALALSASLSYSASDCAGNRTHRV